MKNNLAYLVLSLMFLTAIPAFAQTTTIQTESMTLSGGYGVGGDGTLIKLKSVTTSGSAVKSFASGSGNYNITIHVMGDEAGSSKVDLLIGSTVVKSMNLPQANEASTFSVSNVNISSGVSIKLNGSALTSGGTARVESLVFTSVSAPAPPAPPAPPAGNIKVVQKNGSGGAYTTIAAAIAAAVPGDTIELRNNTAGATQTWSERIDFSNKSGTASKYITLKVRNGDTVKIRTTGNLLNLSNSSYIVVDGLSNGNIGLYLGDVADYNHNNFQNCYPQTHSFYAASSHHFQIRNVLMTGSKSYSTNVTDVNSYQFLFKNIIATKHGTNALSSNPSNGNAQDWGDLFQVEGHHGIIDNFKGDHGGHNPMTILGHHIVVRNSTGDGYWGDISSSPGSRAAVFHSGTSGPILAENNVFKNADDSVDNNSQALIKTEASGFIFRGNYLFDSDAHLFHSNFNKSEVGKNMSNMYIYNNTSYDSGGIWYNNGSDYQASMGNEQYQNNRIVNNIFQKVYDGPKDAASIGDYVVRYDTTGFTSGGFSNAWRGTKIANNVFGGDSVGMSLSLKGALTATGKYLLSSIPTSWSSNIYGNMDRELSFQNVGSPRNRTPAGFAVTGWGGLSAGDAPALAVTTNSSPSSGATAGTSLTVDNAGYFYDGWGIESEQGDYIAIGNTANSAQIVQIKSVNVLANSITLSSGIKWTNGMKIWFAGNPANGPAKVFDNRGATQ